MESEPTKPVVVFIDDDPDLHRLVKARLRHEDIDLHTAAGGEEGLRLVKHKLPAVVMLDLDMPGMDGFSVIRALKSDPATVNIAVIIVSGLTECGDKVTAFDLGATDYITKPFDFGELRARLRAALRTNRLLRLLSERAELDGLTGLGNRASFDRRFASEVANSKRYGHPLSLALLDIDFFKRINDTFGHQAGDEVLISFSALIQRQCRASDVACRYGGEEFAVIMTNTNPADSVVLLDRIRTGLEQVVFPRHPEHHVTVSAGVAGFDAHCPAELTEAQWIQAADQALYAAKHGGRNKIMVAPGVVPTQAVSTH